MTKTVLLGDEIELAYGKGLPQRDRIPGPYPVFGSNGQVDTHKEALIKSPGVIVGRKGSVGEVVWSDKDFWPIDTTYYLKLKKPGNIRYWYYQLKALGLEKLNSHSAIPGLNREVAYAKEVIERSPSEQDKIADILGKLDEKIELNRRMNETLEKIGQTLFKHYFINNPEIKNWKDGKLGDIIVNFDSKRKPLSSRQRAGMKGKYRYFGATSVMDHVNDYIFDGIYLLLAEDGSVIKPDGTPYLQYIWGKFWVNNHAHILKAKAPFTVEYLYLLLSQSNVQSLVSGAVQLKINQKAMNSFRIKLTPDDLVKEFSNKIDSMFAQRRKNEEEIQTLTKLRDSLLPRLISGKIKV
jgi:type I restriction enzyme S subunit